MPYRAWLRHVGRSLAERLDRLRGTFETLRERLRKAVAQAVGQSVAGLGAMLGMDVWLIDDRPEFLSTERLMSPAIRPIAKNRAAIWSKSHPRRMTP